MTRDRKVWSSSPERVVYVMVPRRPGRFRRAARTGVLLTVIGLRRVTQHPRWRCAAIGVALIIPGLLLRHAFPENFILLPGLMLTLYAPFLPGEVAMDRRDHARLRRELAAYSTPADRRDFETMLRQYPDQETQELRGILARQDLMDMRYGLPGRGPR